MHGLTIEKINRIENINHHNDVYIYFDGGHLVFNPINGPLRFWYRDELVILVSKEDAFILREKLTDAEFTWDLNYGYYPINIEDS